MSATFWPSPATSARRLKWPPSSATGARRFRNGKRPTTRLNASGVSIRKVRRSSCSKARQMPRDTHVLTRGEFPQARADRCAGRAKLPAAAAARLPADAADVCPLADRSQVHPRPHGPSSIASGRRISASASSARARTSARNPKLRRIRSCWIGWPSSSWTTAGA